MDLRRLRAGEWIAALAGVALLVSLFLPWFSTAITLQPGRVLRTGTVSAWEAFSVLDVLLFAAGLAGIAVLVSTATARTASAPLVTQTMVFPVIAVLGAVTLIQVLAIPGDFTGRKGGAWLGLASLLVLAAGLAIAMRDERLSTPGRHTDQTGRPIPAPREIPTIPPPRAEA